MPSNETSNETRKVEHITPEPIIRKPIRMSARSERYKNLVVHAF